MSAPGTPETGEAQAELTHRQRAWLARRMRWKSQEVQSQAMVTETVPGQDVRRQAVPLILSGKWAEGQNGQSPMDTPELQMQVGQRRWILGDEDTQVITGTNTVPPRRITGTDGLLYWWTMRGSLTLEMHQVGGADEQLPVTTIELPAEAQEVLGELNQLGARRRALLQALCSSPVGRPVGRPVGWGLPETRTHEVHMAVRCNYVVVHRIIRGNLGPMLSELLVSWLGPDGQDTPDWSRISPAESWRCVPKERQELEQALRERRAQLTMSGHALTLLGAPALP